MKVRFFCWLMIVGVAVSCDDPEVPLTEEEQLAIDLALIDEYLGKNNIQAESHFSGLRYVIHTMGTGPKPTKDNCLTVSYVGRILGNEEPFDSSDRYKAPLKNYSSIGSHIAGWQIGFKLLPVGSKATFYVPSKLAYGATGSTAIPANSILVFDVELIAISAYNAAGDYCN